MFAVCSLFLCTAWVGTAGFRFETFCFYIGPREPCVRDRSSKGPVLGAFVLLLFNGSVTPIFVVEQNY